MKKLTLGLLVLISFSAVASDLYDHVGYKAQFDEAVGYPNISILHKLNSLKAIDNSLFNKLNVCMHGPGTSNIINVFLNGEEQEMETFEYEFLTDELKQECRDLEYDFDHTVGQIAKKSLTQKIDFAALLKSDYKKLQQKR